MSINEQNQAPENESIGAKENEDLGTGEVQEPTAPIAEELQSFDSRGDIFARAQAANREKPKVEHEEPKSMFRTPATLDLSPELQERYEKLGSTGKTAIDNLLAYVRGMRPRMPVDTALRYRYQSNLYSTLKNVIKYSDNDFRKNMTAVLRFFRDFNNPAVESALSDRYVHRDLAQMPMNADALKQFPLLVEMFKGLAESKTRQEFLRVRNKDGNFFDHILKHDFTSDDRERVKGYFAR